MKIRAASDEQAISLREGEIELDVLWGVIAVVCLDRHEPDITQVRNEGGNVCANPYGMSERRDAMVIGSSGAKEARIESTFS